ncbi:hypothetical protein MRB53_017875 [Persea americana]|uniref:Uncharacterized protein n=1 Tax=Persea americana TaxID=3435 RepID=A0ACC2M768_PERAE|nr:hypothetical protein MRB53_017875 [Persea americana]
MAEKLVEMVLEKAVDVALGNLFEPLFESIFCFLKSFKPINDFEEQLQKLQRTHLKIQALLQDSDSNHPNNPSHLSTFLGDLRDISYDIEDVLDEAEAEKLKLRAQTRTPSRKRKRVCDSSPPSHFSDRNSPSPDDSGHLNVPHRIKLDIIGKIAEIRERLSEIAKDRDELSLGEVTGDRGIESGVVEKALPLQTSSVTSEFSVFGRDPDREHVIELLVSEGGDSLCVVPIVGKGGLGKTTLARCIYNDKRVIKRFRLRAWVTMSVDFDLCRVCREIMESATGRRCELENLDPLQVRVKRILTSKRFLLVLDDVWSESSLDWERLRAQMKDAVKGSRIIVTTRSENIANIMGTVPAYALKGLSDADCWSVFKQQAFGVRGSSPQLEEIGKKIVKKCNGLPLAAKTLGSLLQCKLDEGDWYDILNSEIWDSTEDMGGVLPALRLSYHCLPSHLKRCFGYCSIFPKGYEFEKEELLLLWMAEGFLQPKRWRQLEDIGRGYFDDLLQRSFFELSNDNQCRYKMHDLIHDLAQSVLGEVCCRIEDDGSHNISERVRHSSMICEKKPKNFEELKALEKLRTFLSLRKYGQKTHINWDPFALLPELRYVRVLDLTYSNIKVLPNSVGTLKHLRYLNLSSTPIQKLPESICALYNLQTLKLSDCRNLSELPKDTRNLISLRHLTMFPLTSMPPGIGKLSCLQTLPIFTVGIGSGCGIGQLKDLKELRGSLSIFRLYNVRDVEEAKKAKLEDKQRLHELKLEWGQPSNGKRDGVNSIDMEVLEGLRPHERLKHLEIREFGSAQFPRWLGDSLLSNLVTLRLYFCRSCETLPPLGQLPSLKFLFIDGMCGVKYVDRSFFGNGNVKGFPSLEMLELNYLPNIQHLPAIEEGEFPCLRELQISNCRQLIELPHLCFLAALGELNISHCDNLASLPERGLPAMLNLLKIKQCPLLTAGRVKEGGEDWEKIQHIPNKEIDS